MTKHKKVYLVIGMIPESIKSVWDQLNTNMQSSKWIIIEEQEIIKDYVNAHDYHPLCFDEWLSPIKNNVIVSLLNKTEDAFTDDNIEGIAILGQFCIDNEIKETYCSILEEQGYEVSILPVKNYWLDVLTYGMKNNISLSYLYDQWVFFNQQYIRVYHPVQEAPKAIIIEGKVLSKYYKGKDELLLMATSLLDKEYKLVIFIDSNDNKEDILSVLPFEPNQVVIYTNKHDSFWSKMCYHYNIKMVFESNPNDVLWWQNIGIPVISLRSHFALEEIA